MKIVKLTLQGIAWGCTILVFIMMFGSRLAGDQFLTSIASDFTRQAIGAILVGIGFTVPSAIYEKESISRLIQTLFHIGVGFVVYFITALYLNWIPIEYGAGMVFLFVSIAAVTFFVIWMAYYLYTKHEAEKINQEIGRKNG